MPRPWLVLYLLVFYGIALRLRGLRFRTRDKSELSAAELTRVDIYWSVGATLRVVRPLAAKSAITMVEAHVRTLGPRRARECAEIVYEELPPVVLASSPWVDSLASGAEGLFQLCGVTGTVCLDAHARAPDRVVLSLGWE